MASIGANGQASIVRLQPSELAFSCPAFCDISYPLPGEPGVRDVAKSELQEACGPLYSGMETIAT